MGKIFFHSTGFFSIDNIVNVNYLDEEHRVVKAKSQMHVFDQVNGIHIHYIHVHLGQGLFVLLGWEEGRELLEMIAGSQS